MFGPRVALAIAASLALGAGCTSGRAPDEPPPVTPSSVEEFRAEASRIVEAAGIPGAGLALVRMGGVEWAGGVGVADRDTRHPITADTHFRAGSISKTFVAMALVQLYEDGTLEIDQPVSELAPLVAIENAWARTDPVTVRQLLQHTAGFDDMRFNEMYNVTSPPDISLLDVLRRNPASRRVRWRPGTRMSYSNPGYGVAGYVLEQVTKRRYEDVIAERIFEPVGMTTSSFVLTESDQAILAKGYDRPTGPPVPFTQIYLRPAGNLHTSPVELARFVHLLLNWGETSEKLVIDPEYLSNMERPQTSASARAGLLYGYGTGIMSQSLAGFPVLGHGGGIDGFTSVYGYSTSRDVGYVVLLNSTYAPQVVNRLASLALRYLKRDVEPPPKPEATLDPGSLRAREGYYHQEGSRSQVRSGIEWLMSGFTLRANGNRLAMMPVIGPPQELVPVSDTLLRRRDDVTPSRVFTTDDDKRDVLMGDGMFAVRTPRWRIEVVRGPILASLALIATVPVALLVWLVRYRRARPQGFWALKVAVTLLPLSLLALASMMIMAPARDWGLRNVWTIATFAGSCALPAAAIASLVLTLDAWSRGAAKGLRAYALAVTVVGLLVSSFLWQAGLIAIRPWGG